ncbi:MAG: cytochrome c3 family protein [Candidatus Xenobia bacterium]
MYQVHRAAKVHDNLQRPTSATCDGCHSVDFDTKTHQAVEWNVGCERCHGPGSEHVANPERTNILNPAAMDARAATDSCLACHTQGRPISEASRYDWPVGYHTGLDLKDYWQLEKPDLGKTTFYYYADGTAHKNRMQGNDFVQSVMYRRGITCYDCHDTHGTDNPSQLRKPPQQLCLDCHGPGLRVSMGLVA